MKFSIPEVKMEQRYSRNMSSCSCSRAFENTCGIMYRQGNA